MHAGHPLTPFFTNHPRNRPRFVTVSACLHYMEDNSHTGCGVFKLCSSLWCLPEQKTFFALYASLALHSSPGLIVSLSPVMCFQCYFSLCVTRSKIQRQIPELLNTKLKVWLSLCSFTHMVRSEKESCHKILSLLKPEYKYLLHNISECTLVNLYRSVSAVLYLEFLVISH